MWGRAPESQPASGDPQTILESAERFGAQTASTPADKLPEVGRLLAPRAERSDRFCWCDSDVSRAVVFSSDATMGTLHDPVRVDLMKLAIAFLGGLSLAKRQRRWPLWSEMRRTLHGALLLEGQDSEWRAGVLARHPPVARDYLAIAILRALALDCSLLGMVTVRTPLRIEALAFSLSTSAPSGTRRSNRP